jgi:hypothetical protein
LKHATGFGEEQTVKVAENGGGGPKRVWKPATRRSPKEAVRAADYKAEPGSGFPELGAPEGRETSRENVPRRTDGVRAPHGRRRTGTRKRSSRVIERPGAVSR